MVDGGSFCTRNGRFAYKQHDGDGLMLELYAPDGWHKGTQVTWDRDVLYDFGGHIWVGTMQWLKFAWQRPPPTFDISEDFWLSAVLKLHGVLTKRPMCPAPKSAPALADIELCACSMEEAGVITPTDVTQAPPSRLAAMDLIKDTFNHTSLLWERPGYWDDYLETTYEYHSVVHKAFNHLAGTKWAECLFFQ